jgi:hypothetical protein
MTGIIKATIAVDVELTEVHGWVWCTSHKTVHTSTAVFTGEKGDMNVASKWRCAAVDWQTLWARLQ